jgi:phospholipid/cholesterol/gamma-HCH transport system permease protein
MRRFFVFLGEFADFSRRVVRRMFSRGFSLGTLTSQMHRIGVDSLTVVNLCAFFIGPVLVIQSQEMLKRYGAEGQVGRVLTSSFVLEIGPVFTAIMFTGRIGTGIAAELASMVVTEQIDAYRVFGADPIARLAVPRVLATTLMLPALTVIANVVGIFSGFLLVVLDQGQPGRRYLEDSLESLTGIDVVSCVAKGVVFGLLVGLIATNLGLRSERDTTAVGLSATRTMVQGVLSILVADLILSKFFILLRDWWY